MNTDAPKVTNEWWRRTSCWTSSAPHSEYDCCIRLGSKLDTVSAASESSSCDAEPPDKSDVRIHTLKVVMV